MELEQEVLLLKEEVRSMLQGQVDNVIVEH